MNWRDIERGCEQIVTYLVDAGYINSISQLEAYRVLLNRHLSHLSPNARVVSIIDFSVPRGRRYERIQIPEGERVIRHEAIRTNAQWYNRVRRRLANRYYGEQNVADSNQLYNLQLIAEIAEKANLLEREEREHAKEVAELQVDLEDARDEISQLQARFKQLTGDSFRRVKKRRRLF